MEEMARLLEAAGMRDVLPLGKARVPVVKCIVPETGTKVCYVRALLLLPNSGLSLVTHSFALYRPQYQTLSTDKPISCFE